MEENKNEMIKIITAWNGKFGADSNIETMSIFKSQNNLWYKNSDTPTWNWSLYYFRLELTPLELEHKAIEEQWNGKSIESNIEFMSIGFCIGWLKAVVPLWDWNLFNYRVKLDTETVGREEIEKQWNGKNGIDCNIQYRYNASELWHNCSGDFFPSFNWDKFNYRVKLAPEYEPYKQNNKDLFKLVGKSVIVTTTFLIKPTCYLITSIDYISSNDPDYFIWIHGAKITFGELFKKFTFIDGSPCGQLKV